MRWPLGIELAAAGMTVTSAATTAIARSAFFISPSFPRTAPRLGAPLHDATVTKLCQRPEAARWERDSWRGLRACQRMSVVNASERFPPPAAGDPLPAPPSPVPPGEAPEVYARREDAERFIEEVRGDEPELAKPLRIEERELEGGGYDDGSNKPPQHRGP